MSTSRLEKFIYAICSMEVSDLPVPLSRIEILWNCLITGETPDFEPQSRNEQYLMAMLGLYELENLPTPMSRGEKLLYKIAMGETDLSDIPAYLSRYEELLGYLAENGGVGDFEYILQTLNQRLSTLYSTKERPMKQVVIKGDTLVNELPRPSLKNTMMNAASQKLNQGYDNGKTLVNIVKNPGDIKVVGKSSDTLAKYEVTGLDSTKNYTILFELSDYNGSKGITISLGMTSTGITSDAINKNGIYKFLFPSNKVGSDMNEIWLYWTISNWTDGNSANVKNVVIIEGDYTNEDIPYFEGTKTFSATPNVVDGEFKQAVVKGQTLVNITKPIEIDMEVTTTGLAHLISYEAYNIIPATNKQYLVCCYIYENTIGSFSLNATGYAAGITLTSKRNITQTSGILKYIADCTGDGKNSFTIGAEADSVAGRLRVTCMVMEYQEGMENWDIPYFEGMQSVQLSEVTTTGKNLFDLSKASDGYFTDGSPYFLVQSNYKTKTSEYIKVEPNTNYIYSFDGIDKSQIANEYWGAYYFYKGIDEVSIIKPNRNMFSSLTEKQFLIKTPSDCHYIRIGSRGLSLDGATVQFEEGSTATPYEPYQSNTLTLAEPVTLRKVGDIQDEFDALTGQVTERIGEIVFDGSEEWELHSTSTNTVRFTTYDKLDNLYVYGENKSMYEDMLCDVLNPVQSNSSIDTESVQMYSNKNGRSDLKIRVLKTKASTVYELKTYLSQNPITIQCRSKESTKTVNPTITNQDGATQTKLHSFNDGHLSVSSQGLLPSAVDYEVPTNNSYYLPDMLTLGAQYTVRGSADCNATIDGKLLALGKNKTFTTPSSLTNRLMVLDAPVDDLMFIKGDQTAKDFGYFEGMKSVMISNKMPVLTTTGKNLFDGDYVLNDGRGRVSIVDYEGRTCFSITNYEPWHIKLPSITKFKSNTITLSFEHIGNVRIFGIKEDGSATRLHELVNKTGDFVRNKYTLTVSDDYVDYAIGEIISYIDLNSIQIEYGTQATLYETFKTNILTTPSDLELRGVGEVQDTLDGLTGEVTERVGEVVLNGSENWKIYGIFDSDGYSSFVATIPSLNNVYYNTVSTFISADFPTGSWVDYRDAVIDELVWNHDSNFIGIRVKNEKASNVNEIKSFLSTNNIRINYALASESIKTVDLTTVDQDGQPTKLKTYNDISYVEINSENITPSVDVEVATKISETLSTLGLEHHDISETQDQLGQTIDEQTENTDATMMATTEIYENL